MRIATLGNPGDPQFRRQQLSLIILLDSEGQTNIILDIKYSPVERKLSRVPLISLSVELSTSGVLPHSPTEFASLQILKRVKFRISDLKRYQAATSLQCTTFTSNKNHYFIILDRRRGLSQLGWEE